MKTPSQLTSRERFALALSHRETDRVPADLGGLATTIRTGVAENWTRKRIDQYTVRDKWGTAWTKPPHFLYASVVDTPIKKPTTDALSKYPFPDPEDPGRYEGLKERTRKLYEETNYAIAAGYRTGAFDLG